MKLNTHNPERSTVSTPSLAEYPPFTLPALLYYGEHKLTKVALVTTVLVDGITIAAN